MARIPMVDPDDPGTDPQAAAILKAMRERRGRDLNVYLGIANNPRVLAALAQFGPAVYSANSLTPAERELAYLTASVTNDCHYWIPTHVLLGRAAGLTEEMLAHLGDDPLPEGVYEPAHAALVRYAQASARNDTITDEVYGALAEHYPVEQMVEICFTVGLSGLINRFHRTFMTEVDPLTQEALAPSCPLELPAPPSTGG